MTNDVRAVGVMCVSVLAALTVGCSSTIPPRRLERATMPTADQRTIVLNTVASFKHLGFQVVASRLRLGVDTALAWRQLDTLLAKPTGDIFWMYPAAGFYLNVKAQLSDAWRARFRSAWKTYTPYRGDTENHFLMYYAALLLMSQEWPDLPGSEWFNGKSSRENYAEAREYLYHWVDETVKFGSTEWDSPRYAYYYITPLILLRDFTADAALQRRFEMMLELTLADYAADYLNGSYCGAHSRDGDGAVIDPRKGEVTSYGQLYFTDSISFVLPDLAFAAMSTWQCPAVISAMAVERGQPFVHTELKRSRARMRYSSERFTKVLRYNYMSQDFCLGSIQGGVHQPIQQHSWDVTFASDRPNNTLFALHPTYSGLELGTFFPEEPDAMVDGVARAKASYTNDNKWVGGSPSEFVAQDSNVLVAVYDIADSDPVKHVDVFIPSSLDTLVRDSTGWLFARIDSAIVAVRVFADSVSWSREGNATRLRFWPGKAQGIFPNSGRGTGALVVVCQSTRRVPWDSFVAVMREPGSIRHSRPVAQIMAGSSVKIANGAGRNFEFTWRGRERGLVRTSGAVARTFMGPQLRSDDPGVDGTSSIIIMNAAGLWRQLNFKRNTVSEDPGEAFDY